MRSQWKRSNSDRGSLLALVLVAALLAACGGPEPTPIVVVVTRAPNTPTAETTPTWTPEPGPPRPVLQFEVYEHPSGAFRLDLPQGGTVETDEDAVYLVLDGSLLLVGFTVPDEPLGGGELEAAIPPLVEAALVEGGLIASYSDLEVEGNQAGDAAGGRMAIVTEEFGDGEAEILLWQVEHVLYTMILVTPDYAAARGFWTQAMDSLVPSVERVPLPTALPPTQPVQPTATATPQPSLTPQPTAQPSATPRPQPQAQPTATPRPQPTAAPPPPPQSGQGCYLFENEIPAELTVTFTAQDRQWSDSFKIPASGTREYCLDPGRYTYTIDAPPPWDSTNGDLVVNPGDRFRWPIRGG
ncbi:MAG: hypothetical protein EHM56_02275 [Chloroflexi bacterium]|nr:MAG: hypothetical protein EHM56_02275 [Chloroflexota bacterium]